MQNTNTFGRSLSVKPTGDNKPELPPFMNPHKQSGEITHTAQVEIKQKNAMEKSRLNTGLANETKSTADAKTAIFKALAHEAMIESN